MKTKKIIVWKTIKETSWKWLLNPLYNLIFLTIIYYSSFIVQDIIKNTNIIEMFDQITGAIAANQEETTLLMTQFSHAIRTVFLIMLLFFLYTTICYSIMQYFIYKNTFSKKSRWLNLLKYTLFNITSFVISFFLIYLAMYLTKNEAAVIIMSLSLLLMIYFFTFFNLIFFKEEKIFKTIKLIYFLTITKLHKLFPAFAWMILTFIAINIPFILLMMILPNFLLLILPLLLWLTFNRYYLKNVLESKDFKDLFKR